MEQTEESHTSSTNPQTKRTILVLTYLLLYSIAMFTLPFVAFFGIRDLLMVHYSFAFYAANAWGVFAAVIVVNIIICTYAYQAYHEKEYDADGNEIDQHVYPPLPSEDSSRNNLKED